MGHVSEAKMGGNGTAAGYLLSGAVAAVEAVAAGELRTPAALGITAIGVRHQAVRNARGEVLDQGSFVRHGRTQLSEDVWFGRG